MYLLHITIKHKGLENFFNTGNKKGIYAGHSKKLGRILDRLESAKNPQDMNLHGYKIHSLTGKEKGTWSIWVNGNWWIIFEFEGEDAIAVDYLDYH